MTCYDCKRWTIVQFGTKPWTTDNPKCWLSGADVYAAQKACVAPALRHPDQRQSQLTQRVVDSQTFGDRFKGRLL